MVLVLLARVFKKTVKVGENIFSQDITIPTPASGAAIQIRISFSFNAEPLNVNTKCQFVVVRTFEENVITSRLNEGKQMDSDAAYLFDLVVDYGESINFRIANATQRVADVNILKLSVSQVT